LKMFDAVVIGDANIDLIVAGCDQVPEPGQEMFVDRMTMHVGGGAALFAISLAKLGLRVAFNGVLGKDLLGSYVRERFAEYGIDTRMVRASEIHNTGISIALNPERDRSFISYAGSNQEMRLEELDPEQIAMGKHVHITGYKGRSNHDKYMDFAKALKEKGLTLSFDVGWDETGEWYEGIFELMQVADVFLMNETEALHYTRCETIEDSLSRMAQYGCQIVLKLGSQGAVAMKDGDVARMPAFKVTAVDTTGAGDSFNAGYLFGFLSGMDVTASLRYGNACGALTVSADGGSAGFADLDGLHAFIREQEDSVTAAT